MHQEAATQTPVKEKKARVHRKRKAVNRGSAANSQIMKVVGARMLAARTINGLSQTEAAAILGYTNSTQLALIEAGKRMPTHPTLVAASVAFATSLDFLYGLSTEPERDQLTAEKGAVLRHVRELVEANTRDIAGKLLSYMRKKSPDISPAQALCDASEKMMDALDRVREINKDAFEEDLKGGSRLIAAAGSLRHAMNTAKDMLSKHARLMDFKNQDCGELYFESSQLPLEMPGLDASAIFRKRLGKRGTR